MEIVYVLTNPAMPGLVKIGRTNSDDVNSRLAQLYTSGVPFPFELIFACSVLNSGEVEDALHKAFAPYRVNPRREFFKIEPYQVIAILKLLHAEDATDEVKEMPSPISTEEIQAASHYRPRRPNLNFTAMGIPIGSLLRFMESDTQAVVVSERQIRLGDEEMSLTAATRSLLGHRYSVQPSPFWTCDGRKLIDIYEETYTPE